MIFYIPLLVYVVLVVGVARNLFPGMSRVKIAKATALVPVNWNNSGGINNILVN